VSHSKEGTTEIFVINWLQVTHGFDDGGLLVNFTNILQAAFAPILFRQKISLDQSFEKHFHMKKACINDNEIDTLKLSGRLTTN